MTKADGDPVAMLAVYWFRAKMMHELLHYLKDTVVSGDLRKLKGETWFEFETYLCFWLSALWVVVEGFNKLKLKDARVQRLFKAHMPYLKAVRHETYHFMPTESPAIIKELNWAEELHEAIGDFLTDYFEQMGPSKGQRTKPDPKRLARHFVQWRKRKFNRKP